MQKPFRRRRKKRKYRKIDIKMCLKKINETKAIRKNYREIRKMKKMKKNIFVVYSIKDKSINFWRIKIKIQVRKVHYS